MKKNDWIAQAKSAIEWIYILSLVGGINNLFNITNTLFTMTQQLYISMRKTPYPLGSE